MAKGKKLKKSPATKKTSLKKKPAPKKSNAQKKTAQKPQKKSSSKKAATKKPVQKTASKKSTPTAKAKKNISGKSFVQAQGQMKWAEFVTPLDDRLIVQLNSQERKTAGGLYIPDTASDVSGNKQGVAVAVGRGHRDKHGKVRPMDVQIGDQIVFAEFAGSKIELLGETLILLRESEVMGILNS